MGTNVTDTDRQNVAELLALIGSDREPRNVTEDEQYVAMLWRMARGLERRTIANPELLTQVAALAQRLSEVVNVALYASAVQYDTDPYAAASMGECARAMGITRQSASDRKAIGRATVEARLEPARLGQRFAEAKREREAIAAAAAHAAEQMPQYHAKHTEGRHLRVA